MNKFKPERRSFIKASLLSGGGIAAFHREAIGKAERAETIRRFVTCHDEFAYYKKISKDTEELRGVLLHTLRSSIDLVGAEMRSLMRADSREFLVMTKFPAKILFGATGMGLGALFGLRLNRMSGAIPDPFKPALGAFAGGLAVW